MKSCMLTSPAVSRHRHHWPLGGTAHLRPRPLRLPHAYIRGTSRRRTCSRQGATTGPEPYRTTHWFTPALQSCSTARGLDAKYRRGTSGCAGCAVSPYSRGEGCRLVSDLNATTSQSKRQQLLWLGWHDGIIWHALATTIIHSPQSLTNRGSPEAQSL